MAYRKLKDKLKREKRKKGHSEGSELKDNTPQYTTARTFVIDF